MNALRRDLPSMPARMAVLPVEDRGYPVPYFVAWVDGKADFRVVDGRKLSNCVRFGLCWLCGQKLGRVVTYVIGPMCAVNRVASEPPSHTGCAEFAARACPFLTRPKAGRREANKPDGVEDPAGFGFDRNPGVALLWTTRAPLHPFRAYAGNEGVLFRVGEPESVAFLAEGRPATADEVLASFESGCELLRTAAAEEGWQAVATLARQIEVARALLPR